MRRASAATSWSSRKRPAVPGVAGDDAQRDVARRRGRARDQRVVGRQRRARRPPRRRRRRAPRRHRRSAQLDAGVAPGREAPLGSPSHIRPTHRPVTKATSAVDDDALAVVAARASRAARRGAAGCSSAPRRPPRAAGARSGARCCPGRPSSRRGRAPRRPRAPSPRARSAKRSPDLVLVDDVDLEVDAARAPLDRLEPGRVVLPASQSSRTALPAPAARPRRARTPGRPACELRPP